jgi:hypothetical protein
MLSDHLLFHLSRRAEELQSELGRTADCRVDTGGGNGEVDFCAGPVSTPDLRFASADHGISMIFPLNPPRSKMRWAS